MHSNRMRAIVFAMASVFMLATAISCPSALACKKGKGNDPKQEQEAVQGAVEALKKGDSGSSPEDAASQIAELPNPAAAAARVGRAVRGLSDAGLIDRGKAQQFTRALRKNGNMGAASFVDAALNPGAVVHGAVVVSPFPGFAVPVVPVPIHPGSVAPSIRL